MNNLIEWEDAPEKIKDALRYWSPHFELLRSEDQKDEPLLTLFILADTSEEWRLYNGVPEEILEDFADYMEDAKVELLEQIKFDSTKYEERQLTDSLAIEMSIELAQLIKQYEGEKHRDINILFYNMLMYSEWVALPEEILEERYDEEV